MVRKVHVRSVVATLACGLSLACGGKGVDQPTAPPAAPTGLVASAGSTTIDLTWGASAGAAGYRVYRATAEGGPFVQVNYGTLGTAAYADGAVTPGATYWYQVSAVNAAGESARSATASAVGPGTPPDPGSCLAADLMGALGRTGFLVGFAGDDAVGDAAPFDLRYQYLSGGPMPAGFPLDQPCTSYDWWACWFRDPGDTPGVGQWLSGAVGRGEVPMFSYYVILQATGGVEQDYAEVTGATDVAHMTAYLADLRFLAQSIGSAQVLVQLEPDFWGYAQQYAVRNGLAGPHAIPAAVASADPADCAAYENSIAGLGQCMVHILRAHAPNALVALHASAWSTYVTDAIYNTTPGFDVAGEARKTAAFLAEAGGAQADFLTVEMCDRDAGFKGCWWDATNATLPNFHQDQVWARALAEAIGKPLLWWQVPVGNMNQDDTPSHYRDNRVQYFFEHPAEFPAAHGFGIAFGAGAEGQTTPSTDGGYLAGRASTYFTAGGVAACP